MTTPLPGYDLPPDLNYDGELVSANKFWLRLFGWLNGLRDAANPYLSMWAAYADVATSVPSGPWTPIIMNKIIVDTDAVGIVSGGYVAPAAGTYQVMGGAGLPTATGTGRGAMITKNGVLASLDGLEASYKPPGTTDGGPLTGMSFVILAAGDRINTYGSQDTGAPVNTNTVATIRPTLSVARVA